MPSSVPWPKFVLPAAPFTAHALARFRRLLLVRARSVSSEGEAENSLYNPQKEKKTNIEPFRRYSLHMR